MCFEVLAPGSLIERKLRETIRAHLEKERQLFAQGVKVLSLFFIDEVAKYRDYSRDDQNGEYARMFEEEYAEAVALVLDEARLLPLGLGEVLRCDRNRLGDTLADGDARDDDDELRPAIAPVQLEHRLDVAVGLAGPRFHLDIEM